jgi:hypothetical protein
MSHHQQLRVRETQQFFKYVAVTDNRTCKHCLRYDMSLMTRREIEGTFKHLYKYNMSFWLPRTHMDLFNRDNCRCALILDEVSPESVIHDMLHTPLEGLTPFQLRMHALALSSIVEVRKLLVKQENFKNARVHRISSLPILR